MKTFLTKKGAELLASVLGNNGTLKFTKAQFGNGVWPTGDEAALKAEIKDASTLALHQPKVDVSFEENEQTDAATGTVTAENGFVKLTALFRNNDSNNSAFDAGWHVTEIGFWAEDSVDQNDEPILYAVCALDESETAFVMPRGESVAAFEYSCYVYVGDEADVTAVLSVNAEKVSYTDFNKHIQNKDNPHEVKKDQVELGNVPNVKTNDQRPTFTQADTFENIDGSVLTDGAGNAVSDDTGEPVGKETTSTIFGKIKKAIKVLIDHIENIGDAVLATNKGNPHGTSAVSVGAAKKQHTHHVSDINDGVLPVVRGGTGMSQGAVFTGNSYNCWGYIVHPGGLLEQFGRVIVEDRDVTIYFDKPFASNAYIFTFDTSGDDFIPVWKKPTKYADRVVMRRTFGVSSSFNDLCQRVFGFRLFGGSAQVADWRAIGKAPQE